jgi:hypothetical protein
MIFPNLVGVGLLELAISYIDSVLSGIPYFLELKHPATQDKSYSIRLA